MIPENARSVERDNQNSLRKYPFSDAASCTNGAGTLPPGAVVDAQLYVPGREPGRVWLSRIGTDGRLHFADASGEFAETDAPPTADSAVPVTFTGDGGPCRGGVVVFGKAGETAALAALAGQSFTADQAELAPAAVAWPGLPGVFGFRLDDGHVVYGDVKIRGENGCRVATYVDADGRSRLRISAVGRMEENVAVTGFVTSVELESDNVHFVLSGRTVAGQAVRNVVDVMASGAAMTTDNDLPADQDDLCAGVRRTLGTDQTPRSGAAPACEAEMCGPDAVTRTVTLTYRGTTVATIRNVLEGGQLPPLAAPQFPHLAADRRFVGYFDGDGRLYYGHDGNPVRTMPFGGDLELEARDMPASSSVTVEFDGGNGTLYLAEANYDVTPRYANPIRISGNPNPVPSVSTTPEDALAAGGAEALADLVLRPAVPSGEVTIGLRGSRKAVSL